MCGIEAYTENGSLEDGERVHKNFNVKFDYKHWYFDSFMVKLPDTLAKLDKLEEDAHKMIEQLQNVKKEISELPE